ncbi:hypothetical protein L21SP3_01751 [Sedimentisphaera cyanobacteriorum]|uniref:DarT domain-containing protein n=1 Tax=Sedimentisphaera cyanobacteriorum TaxID=1940790 RepID=A0A1Q2HRA3_9BACT|nr:DUF4433 domain-containing protein [Sedimentisphaera cyanobacteriorum]AQQ09930.1 hypothetical protein L21SP3_01751 [Sedimentisphaera cyanobacteriorum]
MNISNAKIYHITHINNLDNIIRNRAVYSDARLSKMDINTEVVGMESIKYRRLHEIKVKCYPHTTVGQYVPFNFCPRSIMLYILHKSNHENIKYSGGQAPILHLQADFHNAVEWAEKNNVKWAYTDINASTFYANFYNKLNNINENINWQAVNSKHWQDKEIKERKQAEFLFYDLFPLELIEKIGVFSKEQKLLVSKKVNNIDVSIETSWYY